MMLTRHASHILGKITSAKQRADALASQVEHNGLAGQIREIAVKECIEPFLTQSYNCSTGKIIDSLGNMSYQTDLVIYHRKVVPPVLISQDLGLFPVECVRYAIEVKSTLTSDEIRDTIKKFQSISRLTPFPRRESDGRTLGSHRPVTVLFAFKSDISGSEIERYIRYSGAGTQHCTVLCNLGKGYWFYNGKDAWLGADTSSIEPRYTEFCMFMSGFMNTLSLEETSMRPFKPGSYVSVSPDIYNFAVTPLAASEG